MIEYHVRDRRSTRFMRWYRKLPFGIPGMNLVLRTGLRIHTARARARVRRFVVGRDGEMQQWFEQQQLFFGFGVIRSGTTFLAHFLNQAVPDSVITHEAIPDDYWAYPQALDSDTEAKAYIDSFRKSEIFFRAHAFGRSIYGEINPFLRRHCAALQQTFPHARFFHLVRDGRDVVRSIMCRATFDAKDPLNGLIRPRPEDPYASQWDAMSRFEKVCWWWQMDNRYLREQIGHTVQFEQLRSDYVYFDTQLMQHLGLSIDEQTWSSYVSTPRNKSPRYTFPAWSEWTKEQQEIFVRICGEEMKANGYTI